MKIYWSTFKDKLTKDKTKKFPVGTRIYKGFQGSGKTLSCVAYLFRLKEEYPNCKIFGNIKINKLKDYRYLETDSDIIKALNYSNGEDGVAILIDEAHLYFGKKTGISIDVLTAISQQRKDRKRIIFTSQIWEELDISLRKQVKEVVDCRNYFGIQVNTVSDGESLHWDKTESSYVANKLYTEIFKHNDKLYKSYDTLQKILTNREYVSIAKHSEPISIINNKGSKVYHS